MPGTRVAGRRGRLPVKPAAERLRIGYLSSYLTTPLPVPVYPVDAPAGITSWGMLGNGPDPGVPAHADGVDDAAFAAFQHYLMAKAAARGESPSSKTSADLVAEYLAYTGGAEAGASLADLLLHWYRSGTIVAFAPVDHTDPAAMDAALAAFHGVYVGVNLTADAGYLFEQGRPWTTGDGQQPDGGDRHCVLKVGADGREFDQWVTWGAAQASTRAWTRACAEEAWVVITAQDAAAVSVDLAALRADIDAPHSTGQVGAPSRAGAGPVIDDDVRFTLYRPQALNPGRWASLLVFAHKTDLVEEPGQAPVDPVEQVEARASAHFGGAPPRPSAADARQGLARGAVLRVVPDLPGILCNPAEAEVQWWEPVHEILFRLLAPPELTGTMIRGAVRIWCGPLIIGEISLGMRVAAHGSAAEPPPKPEPVRRYRKIFPSYSHRDGAVVESCAKAVRLLGDQYLQDVLALRAGEPWDTRLLDLIEEADVFQLFWSSHSMRSPHCQDEWEHALALHRPAFVRPVYWEDPLPQDLGQELPPAGLRALHFAKLQLGPPAPAGTAPAQGVTSTQQQDGPGAGGPAAPAPPIGQPGAPVPAAGAQRRRRRWLQSMGGLAAAAVAGVVAVSALANHGANSPAGAEPTSSSSAEASGPASPSPTSEQLPPSELQPGDCLIDTAHSLNADHSLPVVAYVVPCTQPHAAEVVYVAYWRAGLAYIGVREESRVATQQCNKAFASYVGIPHSQSAFSVTSIFPSYAQWGAGARQLICVAYKPTASHPAGAPLHASIRDSRT